MGKKSWKSRPKKDRSINNESFFSNSESVGAYWSGVKMARRQYRRVEGTGAVHNSKPLGGVVVVNPKVATIPKFGASC
jgi:hypothetical protein